MCLCVGKRVKELAVGLVHVLALTETGEVYSWGKQEYAQCGDSAHSDEPRLVSPLCGKTIVGIASGPTQVDDYTIFVTYVLSVKNNYCQTVNRHKFLNL